MKETPLLNIHKSLKANLINFGGYRMPLYYNSALQEHRQVRNNLGIFDVSHMGEFIVAGKHALSFLQKITSNNVNKLKTGKAQYTLLINEKGGVVDDLILYQLEDTKYMLVVNASNIEKDYNWLLDNKPKDVYIENISDKTALLALQGPLAIKVLENISDEDVSNIAYYHFKKGKISNIEDIIISATGYTGAGGFELYLNNDNAEHLWNAIMEAAANYNITPAGLAARNSLRLEKGYCLYGHEIDEEINPLEAKLSWVIDFNKNFIGKESLVKAQEIGLNRELTGVNVLGKVIPRQADIIVNEKNIQVGTVTSGCFSPTLEKPIAMAYIYRGRISANDKLFVQSGSRNAQVELTKLPFV